MMTISLELPDELVKRLTPFQDRLPEIIELGLRYWQNTQAASPTPRQRVEQLWATAGLIVPLDPKISEHYPRRGKRPKPIRAGGKPASQIIIEQRGNL